MFEQRLAELQSTDAEIRKKAVKWLERRETDERAFQPLLSMLNDPNAEVRKDSVTALAQKYKSFPICEPLLARLDDEAPEVVHQTLWSFRSFKATCAVERLIHFVQTHKPPADQTPDLWKTAIEALENIGTEQALTVVRDAKEHEIPDLINRHIANLSSPDPETQCYAIDQLVKMKVEAAIEPILRLLKDPNASVRLRVVSKIADLLSNLEPLFPVFWDSDDRVVKAAVHPLRNKRDTRAIPELIGLLKTRKRSYPPSFESDRGIWETIIFALKTFGTPEALAAVAAAEEQNPLPTTQQLLAAVVSDGDADTRAAIIRYLGSQNDLNQLLVLLHDPDARLRMAALMALHFSEFRVARVFEHLQPFLNDPDGNFKEQAILWLCNLREPRTVVPLASALSNYLPHIGYGFDMWGTIIDALFEIGTPEAYTAIIENAAQLLQHDDDRFKASAIYTLGRTKDARSIILLQGVLAKYSPSPEADLDLWQITINQLERMGTSEAAALVEAAKRQYGK